MFYSRSIVGPVLLIAIGALFLGINLGYLDQGVWRTVWRLWPVLLILLGVELLLGRPRRPQTVTVSQPLAGAARADVTLRFQVGRLHLGAGERADLLAEGVAAVSSGDWMAQHLRQDGDTARFELRDEAPAIWTPFGAPWHGDRWLRLGLNPGIPLRLRVHTGVGEASLDLSRLNVTDLDLHTGVGRTEMTLPARGQVTARVEGGVGEVRIRIPAGMAARVRARAGLGATRVDGPFTREGDFYISPGSAAAADRVDLDVRGGVGQISIRLG